jgi:hypothetical protein
VQLREAQKSMRVLCPSEVPILEESTPVIPQKSRRVTEVEISVPEMQVDPVGYMVST